MAKYSIQYYGRLTPKNFEKPILLATMRETGNEGRFKVVVNFSRTYGSDGHKLLAEKN